ncbi:MAG TPA: NUDIX hydrolase [Polyangiaceae bacterium]|nr:NUDIX hydrolase [Polyangiaceae bacterium]
MNDRSALLVSLTAALRGNGLGPAWGSGRWARPLADDHRRALLELIERGQEAFARHHFVPGHFTASAFVLSPDGAELLLIRHAKLGLWLQPGGHIEPDDADLTAAALRELREETSVVEATLLEPHFDVDVHVIPAFGEQPAHLHHDVRILLRASTREIAQGDDALDAAWFPLSLLATGSGPLGAGLGTDESVRRVARHLAAIPLEIRLDERPETPRASQLDNGNQNDSNRRREGNQAP